TVLEGVLKTSGRVRDFTAARQAGALRCTAAPPAERALLRQAAGEMSSGPTGRNRVRDERGSGRGTLGCEMNAARPPSLRYPRLRASQEILVSVGTPCAPRELEPRRTRRRAEH